MDPDRYIAVNAIRSIDLLDHLVDTRHSIFLNDLFVRGLHPFIKNLGWRQMLHTLSIFATMDEIMKID